MNGTLSVEVRGAPHAGLVSCEGEHGKRNGDWKVDSNLTSLDISLELACSVPVFREDGSSIAPLTVVREIDGLLESFNANDLHHWSEYFLLVAVNASTHMVDDSWSNEVSFGVTLDLNTSAVKEHLTVLRTIFNQALDLSEVLSVVEGSYIGVVPASANSKSFRLLDDLRDPLSGVTNHDDDGKSHASLSGGAEARSNNSVDGISLVSIWHDNGVVLGTHIHLGTLAMSACS